MQKAQTERLGVAGVDYFFSQHGWLFREQPTHDYGIDAHVEIVITNRPTGKLIALQIKSGTSFFSEETADAFVFNSGISQKIPQRYAARRLRYSQAKLFLVPERSCGRYGGCLDGHSRIPFEIFAGWILQFLPRAHLRPRCVKRTAGVVKRSARMRPSNGRHTYTRRMLDWSSHVASQSALGDCDLDKTSGELLQSR